MNTVTSESVWLNDAHVCRIEHLAEASGLSIGEIEDLVEHGVIVPVADNVLPYDFQLRDIVTARMARRVRDDFELDRNGVSLSLRLLQRIAELENELNALRPWRSGW